MGLKNHLFPQKQSVFFLKFFVDFGKCNFYLIILFSPQYILIISVSNQFEYIFLNHSAPLVIMALFINRAIKPNYPFNFYERRHNYDWSIKACLIDQ